MSTVIFIANTPFHNFVCNYIRNSFSQKKESILITSKHIDQDNSFSRVIIIRDANLKKLIDTRNAIQLIGQRSLSSEIHIFIPHIISLISNYVFSRHPNQFSFYYEGILNFYSYRHEYKIVERYQKTYLARIFGYKFNFRPDIFPINDVNYINFYTVLPNETLGSPHKKIEIKFKSSITKADEEESLIILGGEPSYLSIDLLNIHYSFLRKVVDKGKTHYKKYYKLHPAEKQDFHSKYFQNFEKLPWNVPIENILKRMNTKLIISYPSSALINIRLLYPSINIVIYYFENELNNFDDLNKILNVYKRLGIETNIINSKQNITH